MKEKEDREHRGDFQTPEQWFLALLEVIGKIKYDTDFSPTTSNSLRRRLEDWLTAPTEHSSRPEDISASLVVYLLRLLFEEPLL